MFRGVHQSDASANGGIDLGYGPVYLGTWVADLDDDNGIEYDVYGGVDFAFAENFHAGIGYTIYRYTDDSNQEIIDDKGTAVTTDDEVIGHEGFDDDYDEVNFFAGSTYGDFSIEVEYALGEHDNLDGSDNDYDFLAATLDYKGAYIKVGEFGLSEDGEGEPDGGYIEFGYATTVHGFDLSAAIIHTDEELESDGDGDETRVIFSANYAFDVLNLFNNLK